MTKCEHHAGPFCGSLDASDALPASMQHQTHNSAEGPEPTTPGSPAQMVPMQLVDLVKPGPSGTVASTAAAATAAHAALVTAATDIAPAGLLATVAASKATNKKSISTVMRDLLRAAEKALASGLGDWHLQSIQDISPEFEQHVLMGALGPETLKHKHKLPEPRILHIYGLLHRHCTGFQQEVQTAVAGAEHREQLLAGIWTAFAQLWDECVQVSFQGEVLAAIDELQGTYATLLDTQDVLVAVQQENTALKERCSEFVRANLDHMLAWRTLKAKADALEGEVAMLSSTNSEISLRAAAVNARNTQLTVQLEGLGARLSGAEQQIQDREAALATARTALLEKDSGLRQLEGQVAALRQQLMDAHQDGKKQDNSISDLERQLQQKDQLVQDAERRVADKQRAYNLLYADFAKQKADAADAIEAATKLQQQLSVLNQQLAVAKQEAAKAHNWRRCWEVTRMEVEDLSAANRKAMLRRHELVASYWPVMARLNLAEDAVAALTQQVVGMGQEPAVELPPRDTRAKEVEELQPPSSSSSSNNQAASQSDTQQQQTDPCSTSSNTASSQQPATAAQHKQQQQPQPGAGQDSATVGALQGVHEAMQEELVQLRSSYLLLQEEYWRQKERLLALELDSGQLKAAAEKAADTAAHAVTELENAQQQAAKEAAERARLEADLAGCRSWIRELERTEQQYLRTIREQGALEQAAVSAQRQADDLRSRLAEAQSNWQLAQAAADAAAQERTQLLQQVSQELNRAALVEQALQQVFRQEVSNGRARCSQLQEALHQRSTALEAAQAQLATAREQQAAAEAEQQRTQLQLQETQRGNVALQRQLSEAQQVLCSTLQRLEDLESRVSLVSSGRLSSSSSSSDTRSLDAGIEAALHMLERLLVSMQCLAADAATISNASNACKVEVLVGGIMQELEAAAGQQQQQAAGPPGVAASLVLLRNAAGTAGKQRCQELERQLSTLQLQLADTLSQLVSASSANARLQRMLNLKTRAAASLERQLGAVESQLQHLQASQSSSEGMLVQLQQELAEARLQQAKLAAESSSRASELQAAQSRASAAEAALEQLQAAAAATETCTVQLTEQLQKAMEVSRHEAVAAATAQGQQAAAALQAQQLQQQLEAAGNRVSQLEREVKECRHKVDICSQAARDAEYRAVEATTLLADVRRELDFSQLLLQKQQQQQQQQHQGGPEPQPTAEKRRPQQQQQQQQQLQPPT